MNRRTSLHATNDSTALIDGHTTRLTTENLLKKVDATLARSEPLTEVMDRISRHREHSMFTSDLKKGQQN